MIGPTKEKKYYLCRTHKHSKSSKERLTSNGWRREGGFDAATCYFTLDDVIDARNWWLKQDECHFYHLHIMDYFISWNTI